MNKSKFYYLKAAAPFMLIFIVILIFIFALIFHTPEPLKNWPGEKKSQISKSITHMLATTLFINLQRDKAFHLDFSEDNVNEILSHLEWSKKKNGAVIHQPRILFPEERLVCMANVDYKGFRFSVTVELIPYLNTDGLLEIDISKVRIGALPVTPIARKILADNYANRTADPAKPDWQKKLEKALFTDAPAEPVFKILERKIRITGLHITDQTLKTKLIPVAE
jgi:hypothetical protein